MTEARNALPLGGVGTAPSEVEVRFIAETPKRTRVEPEHRNLGRPGAGWEGERDGVRADQGWALYLRRYTDQIASDS